MQLRYILAASAISLLASPAFALQAAPKGSSSDSGGAPSFDELDKDHKGSIGRSDIPKDVEALKQLRAHFGEADADHNGRLSPAEYNSYIGANKVPGADQHH